METGGLDFVGLMLVGVVVGFVYWALKKYKALRTREGHLIKMKHRILEP